MIKILPINPIEPYFKVVINYMIGDARGDTCEELHYSREELEEELPLIKALKKLKPLKGHWGICFDNYPKEYPGEYIGVSKEEYGLILKALTNCEEYLLGEALRSDIERDFLVFEGIDVTYIDENNAEHEVEIS